MNLLCWEGYEADSILGEFTRRFGVDAHAQTLLGDSATAHALLARRDQRFDVLNINNPWIRDFLCPHGLIKTLPEERFATTLDKLLPAFAPLSQWARNEAGDLVGVCQRFGAFNLVVNTDRIDRQSAEDQGFELANQRDRPFGILCYDDFNLFHICIGAGLNPFVRLDERELDLFSATATDWFSRASKISDDHHQLNRALLSGEIDFYISGGVYTVSAARLAGHLNLRAITPDRGSIDGRGGIVFAEVSSVLEHAGNPAAAMDFLGFIVQPEIALRIALSKNTLNPVAQMGDPAVLARFNRQQLDAIQWDSLSADLAKSAMYRIPPSHDHLHQRLRSARDGAAHRRG